MKNNIKNHSLRGTIQTTSTTASGKQAIISFAYGWDALNNKLESYDGCIIVENKTVASFCNQMFKMYVITEDYQNIADYGRLIGEAIAEFEAKMTNL